MIKASLMAWGVLLALSVKSAFALTITYQATDEPDPGSEDLWTYHYVVSGRLNVFDNVRISFDSLIHDPLNVAGPPLNWYAESGVGTGAPLFADGYVLLSRLDEAAITPQVFDVSVVRHVQGPVAPQAFEVLDPNFDPIDAGSTSIAVVPEPAGAALLALGLGAVASISRWRKRSSPQRSP